MLPVVRMMEHVLYIVHAMGCVDWVPCRSWRVVKLSCVGSMGLSFMGTLRATQIRHDWKSRRERKDVTKRTRQRQRG